MSGSSLRALAAAQTVPVAGDIEDNLAQHVRLARAAADMRAQVVVYPELSLTGYEPAMAAARAFSRHDARLGPLLEAAAACSLTLIAGAPVRLGSRLHIGAFLLSPDGAVGLYTKHHLGAFSRSARSDGDVPPPESTVFHAGEDNPLLRIGRATAAVAVCADTGRPAHAEAAVARGADTYLVSMFVIPSEFRRESAALAGYASRHAMAVAMANFGGPTGGLVSAGRSSIWSPGGELLARLGASGPGVVVAEEEETGWRARALAL
jgi:predicted amidohydrolase